MDKPVVRISVRNLVEFILRSGDFDNRGGSSDREAMQKGSRLHRKIQGRMGSHYRAEVSLKYKTEYEDVGIQVEGRADGIFTEDGQCWIDEIKGVYADVSQLEKPVEVHRAQAMCYAWIYAQEQKPEKIGNSRPASCAEHQVTHLWDMEVINGPLDALHGEKVSVAALLVLEEYKRIAAAITQGRCHAKPYENEDEELLKETFGKKGLLEEIRKENEPELLETISPQHLEKCLNGIEEIIDELPSEQTMFRLLEKAGCAKTVYDIGLDESAVLPSLRLAPYTRRRLSLLRISKMLDIRGE